MLTFLMVHLLHEWFSTHGFAPFFTVHDKRGATSANLSLPLYERPCSFSVSSQPCCRAQAGLVPPHKVLPLVSGRSALSRSGSVPGSSVWAEGEAEASRAVADLEQAVGTEEGVSFASSNIVDILQVIVDCNVAELLPPLQPPPSPPQEDDTCQQDQHQDGQDAGDGEGGGGGLRGLTQGGLEAGLQGELTAGTHEAFGALAHRPGEVGEAGAPVLAWEDSTGI